MLGAGTIINPIIKIVTTVAILAAVGVFIVKPVLETTEEVSSNVNESINQSLNQSSQASQNAALSSAISRARSYISSLAGTWPAAAAAIRDCLRQADKDVAEAEHCADFGQRVTHQVQSNRSFALSYADSLRLQGDTAAAERIEDCVKEAGFETAAMRRCRNLADELLFG